MKRRTFIKNTTQIGAGLALSLSIPACMNKQNRYTEEIGLQLWTVRNQLAENPAATLKAVKRAGYYQVELMDTAELKTLLPLIKDAGLVVKSSFINWSFITGRWDLREEPMPAYGFERVIEDAQKEGLTELVFGYMMPEERKSLDDYRKVSDQLNVAGAACQEAGIQLSYHNHAFEFEPMEDSNGYEILIERLDAAAVKFELDVFWSSLAGVAPTPLMQRLENRIRLLHLKDKLAGTPTIYDNTQVPDEAFQPLGKGVVDLDEVLELAPSIGVKYCMVEQDQSPDPIQDIGISRSFLLDK
ncbi:MAG: sugar phosphate isomerase/epimerase [Bacteroidota bacterium]